MPRPRILRNVNGLPPFKHYGPIDRRNDLDIITMSIEEYESIRLIDHLNLTQAEAAMEMGIGRTTVQRIYFDARKKLASSIVLGHVIQFDGGDYRLNGRGRGHGQGRGQHRGQGRNKRD